MARDRPQGAHRERGFDYANLFCNPDLADPARPVAITPGRFERRVEIVCRVAGLERRRLLQWVLAWADLSAAWLISDGTSPETDLRIAHLAAAQLGR
jgi:streptomycin 6-kinase